MTLVSALRRAFSNTMMMYFMAHAAHWNARGPNFPQMHEFFEGIYTEVYSSIDSIAEHMRAVGATAPSNLREVCSNSNVSEMAQGLNCRAMVSSLLVANQRVIEALNMAYESSDKNYGLQNFIADRLEAHAKHRWMLMAYLDNNESSEEGNE